MIKCKKVIPVLRMFDLNKTIEFYVEWLEFKIDWQHKYGENFPVFMQVSLGDLILRLSEHHGDGSPNSRLTVLTEQAREFHSRVGKKDYKYNKPGFNEEENSFTVIDPCGNQITFKNE